MSSRSLTLGGLIVALAALGALWLWAGAAPAASPAAAAAGSVADGRSPLRFRGVAIQLNTGHKPVETFVPMLREIRDLGADTVLLCTAGAMEHAKAQTIFVDARKNPSADETKAIIREAKELGLRVFIMPIVLLTNPRGSEWRGVIDPPNWDDWWRQYREFVTYYADIAREGGADVLMIGSELVSAEKYSAQWVKLIESARGHFPGQLGYSANWDHYKPVQFWDKLDIVGMTSYYTLADRKNPSVDDIAGRWKPIRDEIAAWQKQIGKPIILTEVGWCSQEGAAMSPWNYYQNQQATAEGHEEQRRLYEAFGRAWDGVPWLSGVFWWEWTPGGGGPGDFGYTPKNKPAEQVLRRWFGSQTAAEAASAGAVGG